MSENRPQVSKTIRLLNLVAALLYSRRFISAEYIRENVAGYNVAGTKETFLRMFERDKDYLRSIGIPIEVGTCYDGSADYGYRINHTDYSIGAVDLTTDEITALAVAATLWKSPELYGTSKKALSKLSALGVDFVHHELEPTEHYHQVMANHLLAHEKYSFTVGDGNTGTVNNEGTRLSGICQRSYALIISINMIIIPVRRHSLI